MPLKVRGGFHSPYMADAGEAFAHELERAAIAPAGIPVYSDATGRPYPDAVAPLLAKQICAPVQWEAIIRNMIDDGATVFVEIGPGKTLCNLIARIDKGVRAISAAKFDDLSALAAEVRSC